ncbi:hypothetical protein F5B19DRAFT_4619 [Rostrohypoxylon terebratum]|nr:hypothetical protein F5B19DRAFT_4619 [Rostrohypoxylon terebratum]
MIQCHWLEKQGRGDYVQFLEEMDRVAEAIRKLVFHGSSRSHWIVSIGYRVNTEEGPFIHNLFEHAIAYSLTHYVKQCLANGSSFDKSPYRKSLSKYVLRNGTKDMADILGLGSIEMTKAKNHSSRNTR